MKLDPIDLAILAAYLVGMVAFGSYIGRRQKTAADFMVSGRSMPWWLVLFSIVATETSTVTFLSIPGVAWAGDLTWLQLPMGFLLGRFVVILLLLEHYFEGTMFTAYEVLHRRFGGAVKPVIGTLFLITRTLADGLRLFLSAIVLQEVAGIPMNWAIAALGIATIVYTFLGGMKAVVWTDFIQFVVYMTGAGIAFMVLLSSIDGGFDTVREVAGAEGKLRLFDFAPALDGVTTFWAGLIGGGVLTLGTHGVDQLMVQRYLCAKSRRTAAVALGLSGAVVWLQFAFFMLIGTALWVFYRQTPPETPFARGDRVFATFIVDHMPHGVLGLVLGAVFSAAMSTLSSSLNSSATVLTNDILAPLRPGMRDDQKLLAAKAFTVLFGAAQILVGIGGQWLDASVVNAVLGIAGFTTGIILGMFLLGIFTKRVGPEAALVGLVWGIGIMSWVYFGTTLAWPWYALVGSASTFLFGVLASFAFPRWTAPA